MPKASNRPPLPTSSSDFALPASSSTSSEDSFSLLQRFRRPSLLVPKPISYSETRGHSPLAASFTLSTRRRRGSQSTAQTEESESDRDRMWTDSSPSCSSGKPTPPLGFIEGTEDDRDKNIRPGRHPATPPRKSTSLERQEVTGRTHKRRSSFPLRPPRIMNLLAETRPIDDELKSEAAFQRLLSTCLDLPTQPRTPRAVSDRGRFPEQVGDEDQLKDELSDEEDDECTFAFLQSTSEPSLLRTHTTTPSVSGDDLSMMESPSISMDIDLPFGSPAGNGSPAVASTPTSSHWRYTPPPTTSAVRSNKRKLDDRYDPYSCSSKRRAVSPSVSYFRDSHPLHSPIPGSRPTSRMTMPIPISIPGSVVSSGASSPTVSHTFQSSSLPRSVGILSSPTLRPAIGLASPIMRPVLRSGIRRVDGEEREVEGAGEAVGGLTLS